MAQLVVSGATLMCSFGVAPGTLIAIPKGTPVTVSGMPAASIMDIAPVANVTPFGMCTCLANPAVASATAAALGVLVPMPCMPVIVGPWAPGSPTCLVNNFPALNNTSKCFCAYGGCVSILNPGQILVTVP